MRLEKRGREDPKYIGHVWLVEKKRMLYEHYAKLADFIHSKVEDPQSFFNYLRVELAMFDELVQEVGSRIKKQDNMRKAFRFSLE